MTKESVNGQRPSTPYIYVCIYSLFQFNIKTGVFKDDRAFRFLSDFGIMSPLIPVVKRLKKIGVTGKIWEKAGVKLLSDLTEKSVSFSGLGTSSIRLLLFLVKRINK